MNIKKMNCFYIDFEDYRSLINDVTGGLKRVEYELDGGIWYKDTDEAEASETLWNEEITTTLSKHLGVKITSVHADDSDPIGVWIAYENTSPKEITIELENGKIIASRNPDPDYDGVSIVFKSKDEDIVDLVLVECKAQTDYEEIDVYLYENAHDEDYTKKSTVKINDIYKALDYTECNNCGALVYVDDCETDHYWTNDGDRIVYHICPECRESVEPISF